MSAISQIYVYRGVFEHQESLATPNLCVAFHYVPLVVSLVVSLCRKAKETAKSDGFTAATFLRTALPKTREARWNDGSQNLIPSDPFCKTSAKTYKEMQNMQRPVKRVGKYVKHCETNCTMCTLNALQMSLNYTKLPRIGMDRHLSGLESLAGGCSG